MKRNTATLLTIATLAALAGTAQSQCAGASEPADCPASSFVTYSYTDPACCIADVSTDQLCSKFTTTYDAIGCHFTGTVKAIASTYSHATYSEYPLCQASIADTQFLSCNDAGQSALLDIGQSSSASTGANVKALGVSSSHYASMSVSPTNVTMVARSSVSNKIKRFYDNCNCLEAGSGSGLGVGYALATTTGAMGIDWEDGGTILMSRVPSIGIQAIKANVVKNSGCDPIDHGSTNPILGQLEQSKMHELAEDGSTIATHTNTSLFILYEDDTELYLDSVLTDVNAPTPSTHVIQLDGQTTSVSFESSIVTADPATTNWDTWARFTASKGLAWDEEGYDINADADLNGFINDNDAKLILSSAQALDIDDNGHVDRQDFTMFIGLVAESDPRADFDLNGSVDANDVNTWLVAYRASQAK